MLDRDQWPSGPWDHEPDKLCQTHYGLVCELERRKDGAWKGCVVVPSWHASYDRPPEDVQVHGNVTWVHDTPSQIRYGFDFSHYLDFCPGDPISHREGYVYRDMGYAMAQASELARQLAGRSVVRVVASQIADAVSWGASRLVQRLVQGHIFSWRAHER